MSSIDASAGAGAGSNFIDGVDVAHLIRTFKERIEKNPSYITEIKAKMTESQNPKTRDLSTNAQGDKEKIVTALRSILLVEQDAMSNVVGQLDGAFTEMQSILEAVKKARGAGESQKIFLVGAGASGRLAIMMKLAVSVILPEDAELFEAVIAGGDIAFVNAVPSFEDDPVAIIKQLVVQGYEPGCPVIGLTASGTANCVKKTLEHAVANGSHATMICCNEINAAEKIDGVNYIELPTQAPALSGSTRMHPTTIMMLALSPLLAQATGKDLAYLKAQIALLVNKIDALPLDEMAGLVAKEAEKFNDRPIAYRVYSDDPLLMGTVFTDATEQVPTFGENPLLAKDDLDPLNASSKLSSMPYAGLPRTVPIDMSGREFWPSILAGKPVPVALNIESLAQTSSESANRYDFSEKAFEGIEFKSSIEIHEKEGALQIKELVESFDIDTTGLDPFFRSLLLKVFLNAHSTTLYAREGFVLGNKMINLKASNDKLVARAINLVLEHYRKAEIELSPSVSFFNKEVARELYDEKRVMEAVLDCLAEGPLNIVKRAIERSKTLVDAKCMDLKRRVETGDYSDEDSPEDQKLSPAEIRFYARLINFTPGHDSGVERAIVMFGGHRGPPGGNGKSFP